MNYEEAVAYLSSSLRFGIRLGLHRMQRLEQLLDQPHQKLRCLHIAGTNGKGSTAAYCASILAAAGRRVGLFTSPYLERLTERIRIIDRKDSLQRLISNEEEGEISKSDFARLMTQVRFSVEQMLAEGEEHPTEFELLTAIAFLYFVEQKCDLVVLETGLGGRLDSTNVIEHPLACIITALGYDHMDRLGNTLEEIAGEKAGIIKAGSPVFLYNPYDLYLSKEDQAAAMKVMEERCRSFSAPLHVVCQNDLIYGTYDWSGQSFTDRCSGLCLWTTLLGTAQPMNATLALRACRHLSLADDTAIKEGIKATRWPARMEVIRRFPPILIDGAHNSQGCRVLSDSLNRLLADQPVIFLVGVLADKDYKDMLRMTLNQVRYRPITVVCTEPCNPRALPAEELAAAVQAIWQLPEEPDNRYNKTVRIAKIPEEGARLALALAHEQQTALCAFGSLYLVGSIRSILKNRED